MGNRFSRPVSRLKGRADGRHGGPRTAARVVLATVAALAIGLGIAACGSSSSADSGSVDIVAYSTPETVYKDGLIPAFQKTSQGADASSRPRSAPPATSRGRSSRASPPTVRPLLDPSPTCRGWSTPGQVDSNWDQNSYNGIVQDSVVVFVVRKGNPKNIQTWD